MRTFFETGALKRNSIGLAATLAVGLFIFAYFSIFEHTLIDDAFITFQYASNLRYYGHWGFLIDQPSNTVTSPLNVILLALSNLLITDTPRAAILLATLESLILLGLLLLISKKTFGGYYFGIVCFIALLVNPLLLSTLGLEPLLYTVLAVAGICLLLFRKWYTLAIVLGFLTLTRADGFLLFGVMLFFIPFEEPGGLQQSACPTPIQSNAHNSLKTRLLFSLVFLLVISPWYLFSWIYFGSALPETFFLKAATAWGEATFANGLQLYYSRYPVETFFSFGLILAIPLGLVGMNPRAAKILTVSLAFGLIYYAAYSLLHVAPFHWYFAPLAMISVIAGALAISSLYYSRRVRPELQRLFYLIPVLAAVGLISFLMSSNTLPPSQAPIHSNWATMDQYKEIGLWMRNNIEPSSKVRLDGETGALAFYSQRLVYNYFGCRQDTQFRLHKFDGTGGTISRLLKLNFLFLRPGTPCGPYDYTFVFNLDPTNQTPVSGAVMQWSISSNWIHTGRVYLVRQ